MSATNTHLPAWLADRKYCTVKHLMRLFDVSRPTIDRWCRQNPTFPKKIKLGLQGNDYSCTRFVVTDLEKYIAGLEGETKSQQRET